MLPGRSWLGRRMQFDRFKRREVITLLGGAAAACPLAAGAQPAAVPVIGLLHPGSPEANARFVASFRNGLAEAGHVEGRNVSIEYRWGHGESTQLAELAAELVWTKEIGERPAVKRGRMVNRASGLLEEQLHERHDA